MAKRDMTPLEPDELKAIDPAEPNGGRFAVDGSDVADEKAAAEGPAGSFIERALTDDEEPREAAFEDPLINARTGEPEELDMSEYEDGDETVQGPIREQTAKGGAGRIAFIVDDMFEDSEFREPYNRLAEEGYEIVVVGREADKELTGKREMETVVTDVAARDVSADQFDALVIPGGYSPDKLRMDSDVVRFTREFFEAGKTIAAICHAGWMLVEADIVDGRTVTSWPSIKTDLINAGAIWVDREVVEDGNLVTSRKPADLPAFSDAIVRKLGERVQTSETAVSP